MNLTDLSNALAEKLKNKDTYALKELAQQAIEAYPNEALGYYYLGEVEVEYWNYAEAIAAFDKAHSLAPDNHLYLRRKAFAMLKNNDESGKAIYEKLLQADPENGELHLEVGRYYMDAWQGPKAIEHLTKASQLLPDRWETFFYLARTLYSTELRCEEALPLANKAVELNPITETIDLRIGINKFLKNIPECEADFAKIIELNPGQAHYHANLGNFYAELENWENADAAFTKAIDIEIENGYSMYYSYQNRGEVRLKSGNGTGAVEDFNKAIGVFQQSNAGSPVDARLLELRAQAKEAMDDLAGAAEDLLLALEANPYQKSELQRRLGQIYMEMNELAKAETQFLAMGEGDDWMKGQSLLELGKLAHHQKDTQKAYDYWTKAKAANAYEAEDLIKTHCQSILNAQKSLIDMAIIKEYESFAKVNSRSLFMGRLFGKCWQLNAQKSLQYNLDNNPMAMMMPDELRGVLLPILDDVRPLLESLYFEFTESCVLLQNSLKHTAPVSESGDAGGGMGFNFNFDISKIVLTAYYKILKETAEMAQIHAKRTGGKGDNTDIRILDLCLEGDDELRIDGLAGDRPLTLYFSGKTKEELPDFSAEEQAQMIENLKKRAQEVLMMFMGSMAQGLRNVVKNINNPTEADGDDDDNDDNDDDDDVKGGQA